MLTSTQSQRLVRLRWSAFIIVGMAYILSFFHRFAPGAIASDLQQTFHASSAELGSLAATYFYVYTVMQIPTGVLADTWGPRRIVTIGGVLAGIGAILFGSAETLAAASAGRLLVGLGVSVMFISMLKLNAAWFHDRHFATMTGMTILLGNVGSILATSPLSAALSLMSWRSVFIDIGIFSLLLALLAWLLVRDNPGSVGLPSLRELDGQTAHPARKGTGMTDCWKCCRTAPLGRDCGSIPAWRVRCSLSPGCGPCLICRTCTAWTEAAPPATPRY